MHQNAAKTAHYAPNKTMNRARRADHSDGADDFPIVGLSKL
jgi:hypothetical protein